MNETRRGRRWLLWGLAIAVFALDQITKQMVRMWLPMHTTWRPFDTFPLNRLGVMHTYNTGAAFGILQDYGLFFVVIAFIVIAGIVVFQHRLPPDRTLIFSALGLQLGGALGNLSDRLIFGHVTDFIRIDLTDTYTFPIFNVADMAIVGGVLLLAWKLHQEEEQGRMAKTPPVEEEPFPPVVVHMPEGNGRRAADESRVLSWPSEEVESE
ncbi:signal peptidase II [Ardenticatena maritima]|uniref:Lipoprotein signal peptidase n=1 Tax=Ardenticatena maritima TaxID=872965 RepID=A0A0M8K8C8_9CHLR|nr:signal peptidase II [Ardenticatena maritima]GAP62549.1 signal peptidase II [Ardenticatena maritima]